MRGDDMPGAPFHSRGKEKGRHQPAEPGKSADCKSNGRGRGAGGKGCERPTERDGTLLLPSRLSRHQASMSKAVAETRRPLGTRRTKEEVGSGWKRLG